MNKTKNYYLITIFIAPFISLSSFAMGWSSKKQIIKKPSDQAIHLAFLDTGFCPHKITLSHKNIILKESLNFADHQAAPCRQKTLLGRRFHGHHVLQIMLDQLKSHLPLPKIIIHPLIIFDRNGEQKLDYWKKAFHYLAQQKIHFVISAVGLPLTAHQASKDLPKLPGHIITFLAAGRVGPGIKADTILFPQLYHKSKNTFLIGSFHPPTTKKRNDYLLDPLMLYKKESSFFFSYKGPGDLIHGTSRSVAYGAGRAIALCLNPQMPREKINSLFQECLAGKKRPIEAETLEFPISTY